MQQFYGGKQILYRDIGILPHLSLNKASAKPMIIANK
jgi:hypothetical protein